jgi:hypothetical protein
VCLTSSLACVRPPAAESRTSQLRSGIRCIQTVHNDEAEPARNSPVIVLQAPADGPPSARSSGPSVWRRRRSGGNVGPLLARLVIASFRQRTSAPRISLTAQRGARGRP